MNTAALAGTIEVNSPEDLWSAFRFTLDGVEYQMPAPVSQFIENGWALETRYGGETLDAMTYSSHGNTLTKGDASITVELLNATAGTLPMEACLVSMMTIYETVPVDFVMGTGVKNGSSFQEKLEACGLSLEMVKSGTEDLCEIRKGDYRVESLHMNQVPLANQITLYYQISGEVLDLFTQITRHGELNRQYIGDNYIQFGFDDLILAEGTTPKVRSITFKLMLPQPE